MRGFLSIYQSPFQIDTAFCKSIYIATTFLVSGQLKKVEKQNIIKFISTIGRMAILANYFLLSPLKLERLVTMRTTVSGFHTLYQSTFS